MKMLSIYWGTCSTVALMVDGEIRSCVSEERFTRIKNEDSYPYHAIEHVLKAEGISPDQLDIVVYAGERFDALAVITHKYSQSSSMDRLKEQKNYWYPKLYQGKDVSYLDVFSDKIDMDQYPGNWGEVIEVLKNGSENKITETLKIFRRDTVAKHLGIPKEKVIFIDHHRAHGYYAYYASHMEKKDKTVILTAEAWGDDKNASVSVADGGKIQAISGSVNFQLGRIYRNITLLLGMKPDEHEYKVMGLAAYAKPKYILDPLKVFEKTMYVDGLGFAFREIPKDLFFWFKEQLDGFRFDSIAGALQKYAENILVKWAQNALATTGAKRIAFGGGVAMNIKAIMEIAKLDELEEIFICPSPSDESLAMGAAYVAMHDYYISQNIDPTIHLKPLQSAYLGPDLDKVDVQDSLEIGRKKGYVIEENPSPAYVAGLIAKGYIIGRCAGKSEFGARALGNRSILADPRNLEVVKSINEKIKSRDFWMPFAPSILEERAEDYLINPKNLKAPYMTVAFDTKPIAWKDLKASLHQADLTARPQIVSREVNNEYHSLLFEFDKLTGVGGLLNTSFNVHGEPIIQTGKDALDVFERTDLDALLLTNYLIKRQTGSV